MLKNIMRVKAIIIIMSILLSILAPVPSEATITDDSKVLAIATLDVCHAKSPMSSASQDMPVINEGQCSLCAFDLVDFIKLSNPHSGYLIITFQKEHPPRF